MSIRKLTLSALLLLAACGGNPLGPNDPVGPVDPDDPMAVPEEVAVNLRSITYNPAGAGTLSVNMFGLTGSAQTVDFVRSKSLDIDGYQAFTYQETGLQRSHLAFVADSLRGNLRAGVVADGGQFNQHYGGGTYSRIDVYTPPVVRPGKETGQFSYAGTYAGVFLPGPATHPSLPPGLQPYQPMRVKGETLINANFANNQVNGGVENRWLLDDRGRRIDMNADGVLDATDQLEAIVFRANTIDENGMFLGNVEFSGEPDSQIGSYGGMFGGEGASDIAGAIVLNPIPGETGIWEYGVFNLPRCDLAGASPLCVPR
ncbi:hypothetical protein RNZ50_04540 [Paracoccaceae bacterium Fryx2]|nr:hypothetical protein [Paracoccaceae bacterium Fryx2]